MNNVLYLIALCYSCLLAPITFIDAFAGKGFGKEANNSPTYTLSDRFRVSCPADISSISQYDPSLIESLDQTNTNDDDDDTVWAAVYRSSNNLPSVLIKDDFMNAMRIATTVQGIPNNDTNNNNDITKSTQIDDGSINSQINKSIPCFKCNQIQNIFSCV